MLCLKRELLSKTMYDVKLTTHRRSCCLRARQPSLFLQMLRSVIESSVCLQAGDDHLDLALPKKVFLFTRYIVTISSQNLMEQKLDEKSQNAPRRWKI